MGNDTNVKSKDAMRIADLLIKCFKMSPHMICMPHFLQISFIYIFWTRSEKGWPWKKFESGGGEVSSVDLLWETLNVPTKISPFNLTCIFFYT